MVAADTITIALNNKVSPLKKTISGFAIGPYGWLEKLGMVMIAISFLLIAINLLSVKKKNESCPLRLVGGLLVIVAIGFLMLSIFNTNVIGTIVSFHGIVHQFIAAAVSVVFYLSCLILMRLMINKEGFRLFSIFSGLTFLVGFIVLVLLGFDYDKNEYMGLLERMIAGFNLVWIVLVGPQVIKFVRLLQ
jgi:hypothetical membrane protein